MSTITIAELIEGLVQKEAGDYAASIEAPGPFSVRMAARRVATVIPDGEREAVLRHLVHDVMYGTVFGGLFDEALDESYAKTAELSGLLADEVVRQGAMYPEHLPNAVEQLLAGAITGRGQALYSNAETARRAAKGYQPNANPF